MDWPLTRTASLADFPDCHSVAAWQQCHAIEAYTRWTEDRPTTLRGALCLNWGAASFRAPGPDPIYRSYGDVDDARGPLSLVYALSVLDRIDQPMHWLRAQVDRLATGGLLVCTFAAWDAAGGKDCAVGHELRHRIYSRDAWRKLLHEIKGIGLCTFGGVDLRYHGDTLGDHTLATLVAIKSDRRC